MVSAGVLGLAGGPVMALSSVFLLQFCSMPIIGDLATWAMPIIRQALVFVGPAIVGYTLALAPADENAKVSTRKKLIMGVLIFGIGLGWVSIWQYTGTTVLGQSGGALDAMMCGMGGGA